MGPDQLPFGTDPVDTGVALVGRYADLLVDTGKPAQFLDVPIHRLIGVVGQGFIVLERHTFVFLKDGLRHVVELYGNAVGRLDRRDFDMVTLYVASAKVIDIGVPKAGETAEEEYVTGMITEVSFQPSSLRIRLQPKALLPTGSSSLSAAVLPTNFRCLSIISAAVSSSRSKIRIKASRSAETTMKSLPVPSM